MFVLCSNHYVDVRSMFAHSLSAFVKIWYFFVVAFVYSAMSGLCLFVGVLLSFYYYVFFPNA